MDPFALRTEQAKKLDWLFIRTGDQVRCSCIELGCFSGVDRRVRVTELQVKGAGEDVQPFVAVVGLRGF